MKSNALRWLTLVTLVSGLFLTVVGEVFQFAYGQAEDTGALAIYFGLETTVAVGILLWLGATVVRKQPRNTIGWLFIALSSTTSVWVFSTGLMLAGHAHDASWTRYVAWLADWALLPLLTLFIPIFLLFPNGQPPPSRWRWVTWLWAVAFVIAAVGWGVSPEPIQVTGTAFVANPLAVHSSLVDLITQAAGAALAVTALAACVALVVRYRRSEGDERQQLRWLTFVGIAFVVSFVASLLAVGLLVAALHPGPRASDAWDNTAFVIYSTVLILGLPAACAVAILKYHLYDLDVLIRKTLIFGLLALFISISYAAIVGGVSAVVSSASSAALSFVAAAILAVTFQPARDRARRIADRVVYGERATPYEVLAEFSDRVGEAYASEDVLARMATVLKDGTGAAGARVLLRVGTDQREAATVGEPSPDEVLVDVVHQGEQLGALAVSMPPSEPMDPAKRQLVEDLASQAGLVLRNVRLIEELRASRQRLVAAQDEERRKLERNLHDGAQQQLVALAVQLKLLGQSAGKDPERDRQLAERLGSQANAALEDLRDLARGIYPPLLADKGLAAALENQARKAAVPTTVEADGLGRYPQAIESTIYFCTLEALNNVAKYAEASRAIVRLSQRDGHIAFAIEDDGRGFDASSSNYGTGLQGMADRLDAVGGELHVESRPGAGAAVSGRVPVEDPR
jgi:signal transduction histidine kinase